MIDSNGFRPNVGIIICNKLGQLLWAKRIRQNAWQFPQGGVFKHEVPEEALYRELWEEVGLQANQVKVIAKTSDWLKYDLPKSMIHYGRLPLCKGQKQQWFLLELLAENEQLSLYNSASPEFEEWRWVDYWFPLRRVVAFKRKVYRQVLQEFAPAVFNHFRCQSKR